MATLQGVMDALTAQVRAAVPAGYPFVCYSGWVTQEALKYEVASQAPQGGTWVAGRSHITVYDTEVEKNTTRFLPSWGPANTTAPTLTVATSGSTMTFAGTPAAGINIGIVVGSRNAIAYQTQAGDTDPAAVASSVAATINAAAVAGVSATATGASVSVTGGNATVTVGGTGTISAQFDQTEKQFLITIWAPSPDAREAIAEGIRPALSTLIRLSTGDGFDGPIRYVRTRNYEPQFNAQVYRRDLVYSVEFSTVQTAPATQIVGTQVAVSRTFP